MIALLIISVGLLGIAGLQVTAMKQNLSAMNHSQAVWIASNMADRIRANIGEFDNYKGVDTNTSYSQDCQSADCTTAQMLVADAADWSTLVSSLPSGRGMVIDDPDGVLVTVMWDDDGTGATGTNCSNNPNVDLTCYTVVVSQ